MAKHGSTDTGFLTRSDRNYIMSVVLLSLIPFIVTVFLCIDAGVAWQGGFDPLVLFSSGNSFRVRAHSGDIPKVTLFSDLPSLVLSLASTSSIATFFILRRFRLSLRTDLTQTGLLSADAAKTAISDREFSSLETYTRRHRLSILSGTVAISLVGTYFYFQVRRHAFLFRRLEDLSDGRISEGRFSRVWWANQNGILAGCWIGLGCLGFTLAVVQSYDYVRIVRVAKRLRNNQCFSLGPSWQASQNGWRPLTRLIDLKAAGLATFVLAILPIVYLLHDISTAVNVAVAGIILIFGAVSWYQLTILFDVPRIHREVVKAQIDAIVARVGRELQAAESGQLLRDEYARVSYALIRLQQLNLALDTRLRVYIRVFAIGIPIIAIVNLAGAIVTLSS